MKTRTSAPCICGAYDHKNGSCLNSTQHTPGPWKAKPTRLEGELVFNIQTVNDIDEVFIAQTCGGISPLEGEANARLIAAAPELLDGYKKIVAIVHQYGSMKGPERAPHTAALSGIYAIAAQATELISRTIHELNNRASQLEKKES